MANANDETHVFRYQPEAMQETLQRLGPQASICAVGLILDEDGRVLTLDLPKLELVGVLPDAMVSPPFGKQNIVDAIPKRFGTSGGSREIIGQKYIITRGIGQAPRPRLFLPVLYRGMSSPTVENLPASYNSSFRDWTRPGILLNLIGVADRVHLRDGTQQRAVTRFAVETYLASL